MKPTLLLLCVVLFSGCSMLPQWRVFQKKAPEPIVKTEKATEVDRQAADLIAREITAPIELKPVAIKLSQSLGVPEKPLTGEIAKVAEDATVAISKELVKVQKERDELNVTLSKIEGKKIEGTGYNIFGFSMSLSVIVLIVLCVMFPPLATVIWWLVKRISGALSRTTKGISNYVKAHPDQGDKLKSYLSNVHDVADKTIIAKIKAKL
jgi:hypothetical protein